MSPIVVRHARTDTLDRPGGKKAHVEVWHADFPPWKGDRPKSDWNGKPVVGPPGRPFAELQILEWLERDGWTGGWVYRAGKVLVAWEPRAFAQVPAAAIALFDQLKKRSGGARGCWDVFCWRDGDFLFAESKWPDDVIRPPQLAWLDAALDLDISKHTFRLVQCAWRGGAA